ncbi:MAG: hypothetical protein HZC28_05995 [Spirochaetes bacterium]|nr:hypothetical protein [Spirochaetota bacterium]
MRLVRLLAVFFAAGACIFASDLIKVKSARILEENRFLVAADLAQYSLVKSFVVNYISDTVGVITTNAVVASEHTTSEYLYLPIKIRYGMIQLLEFDVSLPLVAWRDAARAYNPGARFEDTFKGFFFCDASFEARLRVDDIAQNAAWNIAVAVQLPTGVGKPQVENRLPNVTSINVTNQTVGSFDPSTIGENDYTLSPFSRGLGEFTVSFYYTKEWIDDLLTHFNISYIYELEQGETFWQPEAFIATVPQATGGSTYDFKGFGIEKLLKKLFWTWSRTDPWEYRRNDAIEAGCAIEYYMEAPLTIGDSFTIDLAYKLFLEVTGTLAWDVSSSRRSELVITPGVWIRAAKYARFLLGTSFVILDNPGRYYSHKLTAGLEVMF